MNGVVIAGDGIMSGSGNKNTDKSERPKSLTPPSADGQGDDPIEIEQSSEGSLRISPNTGPGPSMNPTRLTPTPAVQVQIVPVENPDVPITPRLKGILKNKQERSPVAPNALNYRGPAESSLKISDNNTEEDQRFSKVVDSKEIYRKRLAQKKGKYMKARYRSTDDLPTSFRPKRRDDNDPDDNDQSYKQPPLTA